VARWVGLVRWFGPEGKRRWVGGRWAWASKEEKKEERGMAAGVELGGLLAGPTGLVWLGGLLPFFFIKLFSFYYFPVCLQNHFK
jgi:hypothetical protein